MIRTQIYIQKGTHNKLTHLARQKEQSMAEIIRYFIERGLEAAKDRDLSGKKALTGLASLKFKGGDTNLSANIDHYLYGATKHV